MPKLSPIKDRELVAILLKIGFVEKRHHATSHKILHHPDGRRTVIAMHPGKDISTGTLRKILRDIDIAAQDFLDLR
ncbi:MAG: type II toxin-antitoxin system HicA family toxin [Candidatus Vogelbacteria bacterium]|nr:type II toxin-antitoxin system HicA family toxin [Candidatus Vogelbacteria bacterium]